MTTKSKAPGKRSAAKRGTKTSTTARRSAKEGPARARATTARSAGDTTRKSAPKRRAQGRSTKSAESTSSMSYRSQVPHTRTAIEQEPPRARRRLYERARMLTGIGRELMARVKTMLTGLTQQLHLLHLPGKRTA